MKRKYLQIHNETKRNFEKFLKKQKEILNPIVLFDHEDVFIKRN